MASSASESRTTPTPLHNTLPVGSGSQDTTRRAALEKLETSIQHQVAPETGEVPIRPESDNELNWIGSQSLSCQELPSSVNSAENLFERPDVTPNKGSDGAAVGVSKAETQLLLKAHKSQLPVTKREQD